MGSSGALQVRRRVTYQFYSCNYITSHIVLITCVHCYTFENFDMVL